MTRTTPQDWPSRRSPRFLTHLATQARVAPSTQNQALAALLFLYKQVLGIELPRMADIVRAKPRRRLPVVLTRDEVWRVIDAMEGTPRLMPVMTRHTW